MRLALAMLALLTAPAAAWEFTPTPVCTLSDETASARLAVTYDPGRPERGQPISPLEGEMSGRTEGGTKGHGTSDDAKHVKRNRIGIGSYEDPADEKKRKRRPSKTGRPGR